MDYKIDLEKIWNQVIEQIDLKNDELENFNEFIMSCKLEKLDEKVKSSFVVCDNVFAKDILNNNFRLLLENTLNYVTNSKWYLVIQTKNEYKQITNLKKQNNKNNEEWRENVSNAIDKSQSEDSGINNNMKFDNFVVSDSNRLVYQGAKSVAIRPGGNNNPLFIYGESGLGKTHLLQSIGNYIIQKTPNLKVKYITTIDFGDLAIQKLNHQEKSERSFIIENFISNYKNFDVLLFDDVQYLANRRQTKDIFFQILSHHLEKNKQIILSSDTAPEYMGDFEARFRTRFIKGLKLQIMPPDVDTAAKIFRMKIEQLDNFDLNYITNEAISYIAEHFNQNVRELEGALNRILLWSTIEIQDKFTLENAIKLFEPTLKANDYINIKKIKIEVAKYYGLKAEDLQLTTRKLEINRSRQIAIYLTSKYSNLKLNEIGKHFGNKNLSSIKNAIKRVNENINKDINYKQAINKLTERIR